MSRRCLSVWMGLWVLAVGGALLGGAWAYGASPTTPEAQQMFIYAHPDGTKYFGLCVRPQVQVQPVAGQSIVILFDTSAGQVGDFRAKALEVLEQLLQKLGPEDRVQLVGVDVNAVALAEGFVPAQSDQMKQAVEKLRQRTPLGATDMEKAILTASELLQSQQGKPRTILYVGKGTSKAKLLDEASFAALVKQLKERRISASSYAIGPGPDLRLLGALAAQTGGKVIEESPADAAAIADQLASVAHGPVFWPIPQKVVLSETIREVYPAELPPLRLDRETVLVGTLQGDGPVTIRASVEGPGGPVDVSWTAPVGSPNEDHNYLPALVDLARKDPTKGLSLPLVDATSLKNAKVLADVGARNLTLLARQALAAGNPAEAERLSQAALKQDPQDPEAQA
ncbi:MAG TPA: VWA domain-containing protein, partial [Thermoguttaceae bacterium]|nr:VWA domain-containing protein [Thermoguttaceae bacterium]